MEKVIKIGIKDVALQANAATPIRYRNLFKKDLLTLIQQGTTGNVVDLSVASEVAPELAFIMAKSAEGSEMDKLTETTFMKWLEDFGPMDFVNALEQIFSIYFGDTESLVEPKKKTKGEPKDN